MQTKKLIALLLLKLVVLLQGVLAAALFGYGAYYMQWPVWVGAVAGVVIWLILLFGDEREAWSRRVIGFPLSTYLRPPPQSVQRRE